METVLLTGASGFTGRYVHAALVEKGYRVVGVVHGPVSIPGEMACDLTDATAVREMVKRIRPNRVVHLAAISFVGHGSAEEFYRVNLFGTLNLIEALAEYAEYVEQILVASSANVYGNIDVERIDETQCPMPVNHYASSKLAMEHMVRTWFDRLPILITRAFNYTGPGQDERFLVPKIVGHFARGDKDIELGNLDVSRDFSDVRDVAAIYVRLLESGMHSDVVNICSGHGITLREVLNMMESIAGYAIDVQVNPKFVRRNEILRIVGDNRKLWRLIDAVPCKPFSYTLRDMYEAALMEFAESAIASGLHHV